jgi:hypothetical protein
MSSFCKYADTKPQKTPKSIDETLPLVTNGIRGTKANPLGQPTSGFGRLC